MSPLPLLSQQYMALAEAGGTDRPRPHLFPGPTLSQEVGGPGQHKGRAHTALTPHLGLTDPDLDVGAPEAEAPLSWVTRDPQLVCASKLQCCAK